MWRWAALATVLLAVVHMSLVASRFCYSEMRWLGDDQLINAVLNDYRSRAEASRDPALLRRVESIEAQRDSCCAVSPFWEGDYLVDPFTRFVMLLTGENISIVTVKDGLLNEEGEQVNDAGIQRINACGCLRLND